MIVFHDGPAGGVRLMLRRVPIYLRVVRSKSGEWDALDQLDDAPEPGETITVYRRNDKAMPPSKYHLYYGGNSRKSAWYWNASYDVLPAQPGDAVTMDTAAWRGWAESQAQIDLDRGERGG